MPLQRPPEILLVDDNETDRFLTEEALRGLGEAVNINGVEDGDLCMSYLRRQGPYHGAARPDLILLDLNMPRMGGRRVMAELAADVTLRSIPVVVLTTSDSEGDRLDLYGLRCSSYIVKPVDFEAFRHAIRRLWDYWFRTVSLPPR